MKKVSIIIPVYNAEKYLSRCIKSILNQDYENIECILIDDGSTDSSKEIIDSFSNEDNRVVAIHKENGGVSSSRNRGLQIAKGDYVQFVDSDDYLAIEATKTLVNAMTSSTDLVVSDFYRVIKNNITIKGSIDKGGFLSINRYADYMLKGSSDFYYGVLWNKLYRKSIIDEYQLNMDPNISFSEDLIFNLEYLLHVKKINIIKVPTYYYVKTSGSLVEKSTNIKSIVDCKTAVISYYNNFYKNIFKKNEYIERIPQIYSYLLSISSDSINLPLLDKKRQIVDLTINSSYQDSIVLNGVMANDLLNQYMNNFAIKYNLDLKEVVLLYTLNNFNDAVTIEEIVPFTRLSYLQTVYILNKMMILGFVSHSQNNEKDKYMLSDALIKKELEQLKKDWLNICFKNLSSNEKDEYLRIINKINHNLENILK